MTAKQDVKLCARCGVPRQVRRGRKTVVCRDCRDVLSREERKAWAA